MGLEPKHTKVRRADHAVVLRPGRHLVGTDETEELRALIDELDGEGVPCLVVNLGSIEIMATPGLTVLLAAHAKFSRRDARLRLCSVGKRIGKILKVTRLDTVFDVHPDEESAVTACAGGTAGERST